MRGPSLPETRTFATNLTALAIMVLGFAFLAGMLFLLFQGGGANVLIAILAGIVGLFLVTGGFLFLLVPTKVDEIEGEARAQGAPRDPEP